MSKEFSIKIEFDKTIDSCNNTLDFEYYKHNNGTVHKDDIIINDNVIILSGHRSERIDIKNCLYSKRSNYKRLIVSTLHYLYQTIETSEEFLIKEMTLKVGGDERRIEFKNEYSNVLLKKDHRFNENLLNYLFKKESNSKLSDFVYRLCLYHARYVKNKDFYDAYRMFNATYTYLAEVHPEFKKGKYNKNADKDIILGIFDVKKDIITTYELSNSIPLASEIILSSPEDFIKLLHNWRSSSNSNLKTFSNLIGYERYKYDDSNLIQILKKFLKESGIDDPDKYKSVGFERLGIKQQDNLLNYVQILVLYSLYRRNKLFHGEHADEYNFLFDDINKNLLDKLSDFLFQLSIDIVNSLNFETMDL